MTTLTRKLLFLCILCKVLVFYCPGILSEITTGYPVPVSDFASHRITRPTVYHGREKRQISHTRHTDGHVSDLTVTLELHGKAHIVDLQLKRDLLSQKYFQKHYESGNEVITRPSVQEADLCHYQGHVRGVKESWAALSTCAGLQGIIYDGRDLHYIQPRNETLDSDHFVYRHSDLTRNYTCGYHNDYISSHLRAVRSAPQGPFKADSRSRYLELVLVADNKEFTTAGVGDLSVMHRRCKDIANIVNALYNPLNIFIALVGVVVWSDRDEINLSRKADETLTNFLTYRRMRLLQDHPNDNAQLLTGTTFEGGIVGKALKGPICTYEYSGGVNMDHSSVVGLVASTVAHEMGHNLGMEHDNESNCQCPHDRCIMAASTSNVSPTQWSTCSLESLAFSFQKGMDFCLRNKPAALFDGPTCGNSFLEEGEECDCGLQAHCKNPCCNPLTCKLHENATCATGECCDFKTCKVKTAGTECRSAAAECDLPEFCTGKSEFCPADLHKMNGLSCGNEKAYCYNGSCRSHSDQCRLLWGPSGKDSELQCYRQNSQGNRTGHCGFNRMTNKFTPCEQPDIMCGLLHCSHLNEQLEFGMESVAVLYHSFFNSQGRIIPCRTASVDLGLSDPDPGLVPDGAICGEGKMCVKQKCTSVRNITAGLCPNGCGGNGVCNNLGKCFCNPGYAYPNCDVPGVGGSEDGGPAADPNKSSAFVIGLYVFFLGIVPLLIILFCLWYHCCKNSRNRQQWLRKLTGRGTTKIPLPSRGSPDFTRPVGNAKRGAFWQIWRSKDPSASQRSDELLPTTRQPNHPLPPVPSTANGHLSSFNANSARGEKEPLGALFGNYKGFSLSPLSEQPDSSFDSVDSCVEIPLTPPAQPAAPVSTSQVATLKSQFLATSNTAPSPNLVSTTASAAPVRPAPTAPPTVQPTSMGILAGRNTLKSLISAPIPANSHISSKPSISAPDVPPTVSKSSSASNEVPAVTYAHPNKPSATITPMRRAPSIPPTKEKDKVPEIHTEIVITKTIEPIKNEKSVEEKPSNTNPFQLRSLFKSKEEPDSGKTPETGGVMFRFPSARKQDKADKQDKGDKKDEKRSDSSALQRVTSLFKPNIVEEKNDKTVEQNKGKESGKVEEGNEFKGAMTLPRVQNLKASKIDRQSLRNLEISDPIPQSNIELPTKVVPVRTAPTPPPAPRVTFSTLPRQKSMEGKDANRAESMRLSQVTSRPAIPQFGSMRGKRPLSVPAARPTSPPPNPPQKEAEYMYDDCFNTVAPLAKLEEEAGSPGDNIYSVIDDPGTPADPRLVKLKSLDDTISASSNSSSDGLLSEIVNELQKKNLNSIYSTTVKTSSSATSTTSLPATTCVTSTSSAYPVAIPATGAQRVSTPLTTINYTKPVFSTPAYATTNMSKPAIFNPHITSLTTPYSVGKVPTTSATASTASSSLTASKPLYSVTKVPTTSAATTVTPSTATTASVKVPSGSTSSGVSLTPVSTAAAQTYKPYSVSAAARTRYLEGNTAPSANTTKPTSLTSATSPVNTATSVVTAESTPVVSSAVTKSPTSTSGAAVKNNTVVSSKAGPTTTSSASSSSATAKTAKPVVKTTGSNVGPSKVSVGKPGVASAKVSTNSNAKPTKSSSIAIKLTSPMTATTPSVSATSVSSLGMNNLKTSSAVDGRPSHVMSMQQKFDNTKGKAAASASSSSGARKQGTTPGSRSTKS